MPKQTVCFSSSTKLSRRNRIITTILVIFITSVLLWSKQSITNHFRTRPIDIYGLPVYPVHLPRARRTSPTELLSRPWTASTNTTPPRIIHQSWESALIPKKWATWSDSWRVKHPEWEWVLWTNEDNRALVKERAPWFLDTYDALPGEIYRADVVRNLYMFFFGG
jgi:Glycosyltransferase sugar-binding region containing DXD motif